MSPLHYAVWGRNDDIAEFLIEKGADIDAISQENGRPLSYACVHGREKVVGRLLELGSDPHFMSFNYPYSYLQCCAAWGETGTSRLGANEYEKAVLKIIKRLFKARVDPKKTCKAGKTALDICVENGFEKRADLIRSLS